MNQLDPVGSGFHPPVVDRDEEEEESNSEINNVGLLDVQKQDTEVQEDCNAESESEKGQHSGAEDSSPVGFWSHELVNVRLHVIYLWLKTGKASHKTFT